MEPCVSSGLQLNKSVCSWEKKWKVKVNLVQIYVRVRSETSPVTIKCKCGGSCFTHVKATRVPPASAESFRRPNEGLWGVLGGLFLSLWSNVQGHSRLKLTIVVGRANKTSCCQGVKSHTVKETFASQFSTLKPETKASFSATPSHIKRSFVFMRCGAVPFILLPQC